MAHICPDAIGDAQADLRDLEDAVARRALYCVTGTDAAATAAEVEVAPSAVLSKGL